VRPQPSAAIVHADANADVEASLGHDQLFTVMVEGAAAPLVLVDAPGRVLRVNQACTELLSTSADRLLGRPVWEVANACRGSRQSITRRTTERRRDR
jgi:PAS domain S-box-containing protein